MKRLIMYQRAILYEFGFRTSAVDTLMRIGRLVIVHSPLLDLVSLVPATQEIHAAWQIASLEHADEHTADDDDAPIVGEAHSKHDHPPAEDEAVEQHLGSHGAEDQGGWHLKEEVGDEEYEQGNGVAVADVETQVLLHAGDTGVGEVDPVKACDGVENAEDGDETPVHLAPACLEEYL